MGKYRENRETGISKAPISAAIARIFGSGDGQFPKLSTGNLIAAYREFVSDPALCYALDRKEDSCPADARTIRLG